MAMPKSKSKKLIVDNLHYTVGLSGGPFDSDEMVPIRLSIRAEFGHRSFCTVRGLVNSWRYGGYWYDDSATPTNIQITPASCCEIIRLARKRGWSPERQKTNFEMELSSEEFVSMLENQRVEKEWYTTEELAEAMGLSQYTVQERWCNQNRIACEKDTESGKWRIPGHEYRRLLAGGMLRSTHT